MGELQNYFMESYYAISTLPTEAYLASLAILGNIALLLCLFALLFILYRKTHLKTNKINALKPKLTSFFEDTLVRKTSYSDKEIQKKYQAIIKKSSFSKIKITIETLSDIKHTHNIPIEETQRLLKLLSLHTFLNKKVSFSSKSIKYSVLSTAKELGIKSTDLNILPYTYSKNKKIRKKARLSHLKLSQNDPFRFFEETEDVVTDWDAIEMINILSNHKKNGSLQSLGKWINNIENKSLIIFLIKAIGHFNQIENKEILIKKLSDTDKHIRAAAIVAIGKLKLIELEPKLIKMYKSEVRICQKAIIKAIKDFNTGSSLPFLEETYHNSLEHEFKTSVANTIFNYNGGKKLFEKLKTSNDNFILKHIETPLIKFKEYA